jgi:hypothetical protein
VIQATCELEENDCQGNTQTSNTCHCGTSSDKGVNSWNNTLTWCSVGGALSKNAQVVETQGNKLHGVADEASSKATYNHRRYVDTSWNFDAKGDDGQKRLDDECKEQDFEHAWDMLDCRAKAADVALMDDDLRKIPTFVRLSRATAQVLMQNIVLALGIKAVFLVLTFTGHATMWMAVFADMGASLLVVGNGLRLLRR